jgi:hypothetical protein
MKLSTQIETFNPVRLQRHRLFASDCPHLVADGGPGADVRAVAGSARGVVEPAYAQKQLFSLLILLLDPRCSPLKEGCRVQLKQPMV